MSAEQRVFVNELDWFKSSYSDAEGNNCLEVAWVRSSYSDSEGAECVEVAACPGTVRVRDSKAVDGPSLTVSRTGWTRFVRYATAG